MKYLHGVPISVSAGEISRNFGQWQDKALAGPVVVTHHGRPRVVLVSADDYATWPNTIAETSDQSERLVFETSLAAVLDHTAEGFLALDPQLNIRAINRVFESLIGQTASHVVGKSLDAVFPTTAQSVIIEQMRRALRTGEVVDFATDSVGEAGRHYAIRAFPYPGGVAALITNQTAEREASHKSQEARALLGAMGVLPAISSIKLNIRGVFCSVDPRFTELSGFTAEELLSFRLTDIVRPRDRPDLAKALEEILQGAPPKRLETALLVKAGDETPVLIGVAPILRQGAPDGLVAVITAIG